jgi:TolA-binding protein
LPIQPENRFWIYIYGFAALVLLVAMGVFAWLVFVSKSEPGVGRVAGAVPARPGTNSLPDEEYEQLAAFPAPAYVVEPHASKSFQIAMDLYQKQNYRDAAAQLADITKSEPDFAGAKFYRGVSLLLTGDRIAGIQELRPLTEAGQSPYLERARFYLAKGLIAEHDLRRAQEQLEGVVEQHGNLEKQAAMLLAEIRAS